ncbi:MAG TPA: efflux RND transporter periplasmic adaptor subunit, partial [Candidatus Dojkabacteria bacterium]|nr:efflux RND transporter periplasmic adaptor subunit [Candidatus Dojkabacteria bacterium]
NNETGNIAFRATFPNPQGILRHGQTGNILIPSFYKNAIIIPQAATFDILDKKYVYIVDKNNIIHSREIKIGAELPHLYIVVNGLSKTDKILLDGIRKVKNNMKIEYKTISTGSALKDFQHLFTE